MSDEETKTRIKVENLPQAEEELTPEEAKQFQGGSVGRTRLIAGDDQGVFESTSGAGGKTPPHIKVFDGTS